MTAIPLATGYRYPFVSKVRLRNFKSVAEDQVGLAPLTLVVGENSSGKSTLLYALRLLNEGVLDSFTIDDIEDVLGIPSETILNMSAAPSDYVSIGIDIEFPSAKSSWAMNWKPILGRKSWELVSDHDRNGLGSTFLGRGIHYVGPLRKAPGSSREIGLDLLPGDVGRRGEFTADLLVLQGNDPAGLPMPGGSASTIDGVLRSWAADLGLVADIKTVDSRGLSIEVKPHGLDSFFPLSSVGIGVSQLVPVLVQCLLTKPGSVILLEQPELHLHPALQQRLADFFIAMVRSGRQLIVETHSEYMLSRLRRRIVEDPDDELLDLAKVVFAERDRETGLSSYREVELSPLGAIEEWPAGFFDQAAEEERAIIMEGVKKLRKRAVEREQSLAKG